MGVGGLCVGPITTGWANPDIFRVSFSVPTDISVFCCALSYFLAAPVLVSSFETRGISQVLMTAVVLVIVCPHEMVVLQVLIGEGVATPSAT
jgi:hypothetical protein